MRRPPAATPRHADLSKRLEAFDYRRLLYLREAVEARSVRVAAERLGASPSSLSRDIARLEAELGLPLLERSTRGVRPTPAAAILMEYFEEQRLRLDLTITQLVDMVEMRQGQVAVALGEGFAEMVLRGPARSFSKRLPDIRLDFHLGSTEEIVRRVRDDVAEIGLVYNLPLDPSIHSHVSQRHPMCVVVRPGHALAGLGRPVSIADLRPYDLGLLPGGYGVRQALLSAEQGEHLRLSPRITINSSRVLLNFAEDWNGVLLAPAFAVAREMAEGRFVVIAMQSATLGSAEAHLITRHGRRLSMAAGHFLSELRTLPGIFRL